MPSGQRILIVDDDVALVDALLRHLGRRKHEVTAAYLVSDAVRAIEESVRGANPFQAIITDLQLPDGDGRTIVRLARQKLPRCPVLMMTASRSVAGSVEAIRLGAVTVLEKPVPLEVLEEELAAAVAGGGSLEQGLAATGEAGVIGRSAAIRNVLDMLLLAAPTDATVLIEGETGTGKELVAKAVHGLSPRSRAAFVAVNCAALPETLVESELFGHEKGAFTGADKPREGRFRQANGGTLFLDEIGEMPIALQAKLLRAIQEREIQPLGTDKMQRVDVRVIAATNRNLGELAAAGRFRTDLYYRLNVVPLPLPPLRERREAVAALEGYAWPGNVREMENLIQRLTVLKPTGDFDVVDLPPSFRQANSPVPTPQGLPAEGIDLYGTLRHLEDRLINEALERSGGNRNEAARSLGLNRTTLVEKLRKMNRRSS